MPIALFTLETTLHISNPDIILITTHGTVSLNEKMAVHENRLEQKRLRQCARLKKVRARREEKTKRAETPVNIPNCSALRASNHQLIAEISPKNKVSQFTYDTFQATRHIFGTFLCKNYCTLSEHYT